MKATQSKRMSTGTMVLGALLTAMVFVLQFMGAFVRFGPFSISLVLIPIVIGAATCGIGIGTWLGVVFGAAVFASGDAQLFWAVNPLGTIVTVFAKGAACGLCAGLVYKTVLNLMNKRSQKHIAYIKSDSGLCENCEKGVYKFISRNNCYVAVVAAAIVCPIVNTGVFLMGCLLFFADTVATWAEASGLGGGVGYYMIVGLVGVNFLVEMASNIILSPVVVRLLNIRKRQHS